MNIFSNPCVIAVAGKPKSGKSTVLIKLINIFIMRKFRVYRYEKNVWKLTPEDYVISEREGRKYRTVNIITVPTQIVYIELPNGKKCGINTAGDDYKTIHKNLNILYNKGCEIVITATRDSKTPFSAVEAFVKMTKWTFLRIIKDDNSYFSEMNLHEFLFSLLK